MVKDLSVRLCGVELRNPVIPASGTFGFGTELEGAFDLNLLGGISLKGTTEKARYGNPTPRIAECPSGMINSVGLQNPGIDVLVEEKVPALRKIYSGAVIANISGFSVGEYARCCARADACGGIDIIEVNISCPNVHDGGMAFGTSARAAAAERPRFHWFSIISLLLPRVKSRLEPNEKAAAGRAGSAARKNRITGSGMYLIIPKKTAKCKKYGSNFWTGTSWKIVNNRKRRLQCFSISMPERKNVSRSVAGAGFSRRPDSP